MLSQNKGSGGVDGLSVEDLPRCKNLLKLGISHFQAYMSTNTRESYWQTAKGSSFIHVNSVTNHSETQDTYFSKLIISLFV